MSASGTAYMGQTGTGVPRKKPCCKSKHKASWADGALLTEYQKEYLEKSISQPRDTNAAVYRGSLQNAAGPFNATTTYGSNYLGHDGQQRTLPIRPQQAPKEDHAFNPWTTYKVDYPAKAVPYALVKPQHTSAGSPAPFVDETTAKRDFPDWGAAKPATPVQGRGVSVPRGLGPFEGMSAYKDDFKRWPATRPVAAGPVHTSNAALPKGAFDDGTMYKTSYTPKQVGPAEPYKPQHAVVPAAGWFEGMAPSTEYKQHFDGKDGRPASRAKATSGGTGNVLQAGPFLGASTYNGDFRPHTAPHYVRATKPNDNGVSQEAGPFNGQTTYGADFLKKEVPYALVKPSNAFKPNADKFDDTTTHKSTFQSFGTVPVHRAGPQRATNLDKNMGPFEGTSTYKDDFMRWSGGRAVSGRPAPSRGLGHQGPFDGTTTYNLDFVPKPLEPPRSYNPNYCESCDDGSDCEDGA